MPPRNTPPTVEDCASTQRDPQEGLEEPSAPELGSFTRKRQLEELGTHASTLDTPYVMETRKQAPKEPAVSKMILPPAQAPEEPAPEELTLSEEGMTWVREGSGRWSARLSAGPYNYKLSLSFQSATPTSRTWFIRIDNTPFGEMFNVDVDASLREVVGFAKSMVRRHLVAMLGGLA